MTIEEFAVTPLAISLNEKHGWGMEEWIKLANGARKRWRAVYAAGDGPARRGRASIKIVLEVAKEFGATSDELVRIERHDRGNEDVIGSGLMPEKFGDMLYAMNIISDVCGISKAVADMTIDEANEDRLTKMYDS